MNLRTRISDSTATAGIMVVASSVTFGGHVIEQATAGGSFDSTYTTIGLAASAIGFLTGCLIIRKGLNL